MKSWSPMIDVLLPFYGDVEMFKESVRSVLNQTDSRWRLLVLNDAHPDLSVDRWIQDLNEPKLTYVRNESNLGPAANFQKCLDLSIFEYCIFFGADDIMSANFIEVMINDIENHPSCSLHHPGVKVIGVDNSISYSLVDKIKLLLRKYAVSSPKFTNDKVLKSLMLGNWMYFPSIVWRVSDIRSLGFRQDLNVCQDFALITQLISNGAGVSVIEDHIFSYRRHKGSDSSIKLLNGVRFAEEKKIYRELSRKYWAETKYTLSFLSALHLSSRLHALSLFFVAISEKSGVRACLKHVLL